MPLDKPCVDKPYANNNQQPSMFRQMLSTMVSGIAISTGSFIKSCETKKEQDCGEILTQYSKCVETIDPSEDINKCRDIIEIYRVCVS